MHERCKDGWLRSYCFLFSFNFLSTLSHTHTHIYTPLHGLLLLPHLTAFRWHHFIKSCTPQIHGALFVSRKSEKSHLQCYVVISCYAINVLIRISNTRSCYVMLCVSHSFFFFSIPLYQIFHAFIGYLVEFGLLFLQQKKKWRQIAKPILHAFCRSAHQLYPYYISMIVILLDESQNLDALTNIF